ncbi:sulfatase-like hydrolase/transferase [bacterium]|nr:sulfatase-like hydrolase/transferase [bacterium]
MADRPNFLVIMADQHAPDAIAGLGHPAVQTPALDRLLSRGVAFRQAYCAYPMCTPSRASFMTGLLAPQHGVWELGDPLRSDLPTWAHALRHAGYITSISGRMHFVGPDDRHGFERRVYPEFSSHANFQTYGDWDRPVTDEHVMVGAVQHAGPSDEPTRAERYDTAAADAALAELGELASRPNDRPWAFTVGLLSPHFPYAISRPYYDRYDGMEIPRPRPAPGGRSYHELVPAQLTGCRRWLGLTSDGATDEQVRTARRAYYGMITCLDELVGRLVARLDELGVADNTWIVYLSDHGDNLGEHGFWSKLNFWEDSVRVPLIVVPPRCHRPGAVCDAPVSLIDWMSTVLDLTGQSDALGPLPGRSWVPLLDNPAERWPDRVVIADYACDGTRVPMRMVRRGPWKASFAAGFPSTLFDLARDPHEGHDRGADPAARPVLAELEALARADGWDPARLHGEILEHKRRLKYLSAVPGGE